MDQLHKRKVLELDQQTNHPEELRAQLDRFRAELTTDDCDKERLTQRVKELEATLSLALKGDLLSSYLLKYIPFANEESEILCAYAMKQKEARKITDPSLLDSALFRLSLEQNTRMVELSNRYKQEFWPQMTNAERIPTAAYKPFEMNDIDARYDDGTPVAETRRCTYRRINHFREYLRQQQGKSRVVIADSVLRVLRAELRKHHFTPEQCTPQIVRYLLKNLNQSATRTRVKQRFKRGVPQFSWSLIYEHTPTLTILLNPSYELIDIPSERERLLCYLFEKTEIPFEKHKLKVKRGRKNFLVSVCVWSLVSVARTANRRRCFPFRSRTHT